MNFQKLNDKLNKNIEEETELVNKISTLKYLLIYVPILFLMFAVSNLIGTLLFETVVFNWKIILIQAVSFSIFFRIFHKVRKLLNNARENK